MKNIHLCIAATVAVLLLFSLFTLPITAAITLNEGYMFVLGNKVPENIEGYGSPTLLTEQAVKDMYGTKVEFEEIAALLRAGSALDLLGYMGKYNISEARAYALTQYALDILTEKSSHTEVVKGLTANERKYLAAVLKAGFNETPVPSAVKVKGASAALKTDAYGNYVSEIMSIESVMGGIFNFTDLPSDVKVYTLSGDEAPYVLSGQSFYLKSSSPFTLGIHTVEHIYNDPEIIVYYHENSAYSPLVTATIGVENTVKDTVALSFVQNPDTGDADACVMAIYFTALLSQTFLCVQIHRRRKNLKLSRIGG